MNPSSQLAGKDKILDYEIETIRMAGTMERTAQLEKIRFSITRLKLLFTGLINESFEPIGLKR